MYFTTDKMAFHEEFWCQNFSKDWTQIKIILMEDYCGDMNRLNWARMNLCINNVDPSSYVVILMWKPNHD
jgi:hypothetical protein